MTLLKQCFLLLPPLNENPANFIYCVLFLYIHKAIFFKFVAAKRPRKRGLIFLIDKYDSYDNNRCSNYFSQKETFLL